MKKTSHQITWDDLPELSANLAALVDGIDQCSVHHEGKPAAHLLLLRDGLLSIIDVNFPSEDEPDDRILLAIGRILVAHRQACVEGRTLLS